MPLATRFNIPDSHMRLEIDPRDFVLIKVT